MVAAFHHLPAGLGEAGLVAVGGREGERSRAGTAAGRAARGLRAGDAAPRPARCRAAAAPDWRGARGACGAALARRGGRGHKRPLHHAGAPIHHSPRPRPRPRAAPRWRCWRRCSIADGRWRKRSMRCPAASPRATVRRRTGSRRPCCGASAPWMRCWSPSCAARRRSRCATRCGRARRSCCCSARRRTPRWAARWLWFRGPSRGSSTPCCGGWRRRGRRRWRGSTRNGWTRRPGSGRPGTRRTGRLRCARSPPRTGTRRRST